MHMHYQLSLFNGPVVSIVSSKIIVCILLCRHSGLNVASCQDTVVLGVNIRFVILTRMRRQLEHRPFQLYFRDR